MFLSTSVSLSVHDTYRKLLEEAERTPVDYECDQFLLQGSRSYWSSPQLGISCFLEMQCHSANVIDATDPQDLMDSFAYTLPDVFKHGEHFWVPVHVDNRTSGLENVPSIKE